MNTQPTILVVDDEDPTRHMLIDALADEGYETIGAANGHAAIALVLQRRPDLILLDLMMPELEGGATVRALQAVPDLATIPVVLMTVCQGRETRIDGVTAFLPKPFDLEHLMAVIERILPSSTGP